MDLLFCLSAAHLSSRGKMFTFVWNFMDYAASDAFRIFVIVLMCSCFSQITTKILGRLKEDKEDAGDGDCLFKKKDNPATWATKWDWYLSGTERKQDAFLTKSWKLVALTLMELHYSMWRRGVVIYLHGLTQREDFNMIHKRNISSYLHLSEVNLINAGAHLLLLTGNSPNECVDSTFLRWKRGHGPNLMNLWMEEIWIFT